MHESGSTPHLPRCGEWIGALVTFPSYVTGEGEPFKPTAVMWLEPETNWIVDSQLVRPEEALPRAAGLFHLATREPHAGEPRMPRRVRVSDEALAHALRGALGDVELVVAPTPEIDEVVASLTEHLARGDREDEEVMTYLGPDLAPGDLAHLFRAAARLYRARPWVHIPPDAFVGVRCERLGIEHGALCVVGQMGESYGFSLFRSIEDAERFMVVAETGDPSDLPEHFMFTFDDRRELPELLVREIVEQGWEVAGPHAYPSFAVVDEDRVGRGLTLEEHVGMTAIVTALAELVENETLLGDAWQTGIPIERAGSVETAHGNVAVSVWAPQYIGDDEAEVLASDDPANWLFVVNDDRMIDEEMIEDHLDAFMSRFEDAPEVREEMLPIAEMLVERLGMHLGLTFVGVGPEELKILLFKVLPNQVMVEAEQAPLVLETVRALLAFAGRELGAEHAEACLAALNAAAEKRLARELADESKFGMAKSLIAQGMRAGFDMTSEAGIAAFVEQVNRTGGVRKPKSATKVRAKAKPSAAKTPPKARVAAKAKARPSARAAAKPKAGAKTKAAPKAKAKATSRKRR
ncbi:MAG TPA: hypothetical protein VFS15_18165 [Kofleriaceae bacterium]|nr:hypothetical protein [Kofleriaceae bacterium]